MTDDWIEDEDPAEVLRIFDSLPKVVTRAPDYYEATEPVLCRVWIGPHAARPTFCGQPMRAVFAAGSS